MAADNARWLNSRRNLNENFTETEIANGDNDLLGGPGDDFIMGGYGNDDIYGGEGDDIIYGNQLFASNYGNDYIEGGPGDDFIAGVDAADGTDSVYKGGLGNDIIGAGYPDNSADGVSYGFDGSIDYANGADTRVFVYGDEGDDRVYGADGLTA